MSQDLNSSDADPKARAAAIRGQEIEALLDERRQHATFNRTERVKLIDAALKDAGYEAPAQRKAPAKVTAKADKGE